MTDWAATAYRIAQEEGHPWPSLFREQMRLESAGFDPDVIACRRDSPAGARGIAQIVPMWHPGVDPCNPEEALRYGARLMISHYQRYQRWDYALAAYNAGAGAVDQYGGVPPFAETQRYVAILLDGQQPPGGVDTPPGNGVAPSPLTESGGVAVVVGVVVLVFALGVM